MDRIIGTYTSQKPGPLLFVTAGVHGNEPSGVKALKQVFKILNEQKPEINGKIIGVRGNKAALAKNVRYIDKDLNRTWTKENVEKGTKDTHEKEEMFEIISILEEASKDAENRFFLDCHTTSSASAPYISVQDVGDNIAYAKSFPTYIIKGFSDIVSGCTDHYMSRTGLTGFVFEAGQHTSPDSIEYHEGMIWLSLAKANSLNLDALDIFPASAKKLNEQKQHQKIFEIAYRHALEDDDTFKMQPGFENFQPIKKGELLAFHNGEKIESKWDAFIFMPLYQSQGNDGFFVVQEV